MYTLYNHILYKQILAIVVTVLLLGSCNSAKHVGSNESLLWQNRVVIKGKLNAKDGLDLINQLNVGANLAQTPNTALFGLDLETWNIGFVIPRVKLFNYNLFANRLARGRDSNLLRNNLVQAPVIYDPIQTKITCKTLQQICLANGFYYAKVYDSVVAKKYKKTCVYYVIEPNKNFVVNKVNHITKNVQIDSIIAANKKQSYLEIDKPMTLTDIGNERTRIATLLVDNGYLNFRQSAIVPMIDTTDLSVLQNIDNPFEQIALQEDTNYSKKIATSQVNFYYADSINQEQIKQFYIGKVEIEVIDINTPEVKLFKLTPYKDIYFKNIAKYLQPDVVYKNMYLHPGELFSTKKIDATVNRLRTITAFQNITVDLAPIKDSNVVNCNIKITMNKNYTVNYDFESSQGTGYDLGFGLKAGLKNNNLFHRGYQWNNAGLIGLQSNSISNNYLKRNISLLNYGITSELKIPHFLFPDNWLKNTSRNLPQTLIGLSYNTYQRPSAFTQTTANGQISYLWQQNKRIAWRFTPLFVTIVATPFKDKAYFDSILNPITKQQLIPYNIVGSSINFEYTNKLPIYQASSTFYRLNIEKVGSLLNLIKSNKNNAQYIKIETVLLHYNTSKRGSNWVNRCYIFAGIPISQNTLPYIKQQSIGGQASLRGWRVFELGPGPVLDNSNDNNKLITNNGDIKLELNSELRRPIGKLFSGAMKVELAPFIDAGNIWSFKDTSNNGIAQFGFSKILKDMAINTGLGLRLDFSLFLIRFDYGVPIKQPYLTTNNGWMFKNDKTASWNRRFGTFQVGINYPF